MARNLWTKEEDDRLIALVSENLKCINNAFITFHEEFPHRTKEAARFRWYGVLRLRNNVNVCFTISNKKKKEHSIWKKLWLIIRGKKNE